jgi:hypothetical protein
MLNFVPLYDVAIRQSHPESFGIVFNHRRVDNGSIEKLHLDFFHLLAATEHVR